MTLCLRRTIQEKKSYTEKEKRKRKQEHNQIGWNVTALNTASRKADTLLQPWTPISDRLKHCDNHEHYGERFNLIKVGLVQGKRWSLSSTGFLKILFTIIIQCTPPSPAFRNDHQAGVYSVICYLQQNSREFKLLSQVLLITTTTKKTKTISTANRDHLSL